LSPGWAKRSEEEEEEQQQRQQSPLLIGPQSQSCSIGSVLLCESPTRVILKPEVDYKFFTALSGVDISVDAVPMAWPNSY